MRCGYAQMQFRTYVQFISSPVSLFLVWKEGENVPVVFDSLNDEPECWTDAIYVFVHDLFHDCCLSCVVQTPLMQSAFLSAQQTWRGMPTTSEYASPYPLVALSVKSTAFYSI